MKQKKTKHLCSSEAKNFNIPLKVKNSRSNRRQVSKNQT